MEDEKLIELYENRDEYAIVHTRNKYDNYCYSIAYNILYDHEDSKECLNDTYLQVWNAIPPKHPNNFKTFIGKITRNLSLDKYRQKKAEKRLSNEFTISLDELNECIADNSFNDKTELEELITDINDFLAHLRKKDRQYFVCRYYYFESIQDIAERFDSSTSAIKMSLKRTRDKLKDNLLNKGYTI